MKRLCNALLLAALLACASPALAQPAEKPDEKPADVCATELTREKLDNPPERKTKFEVMEEPLQLRLHDVKAVDQKYVAVVRIELPKSGSRSNSVGTTAYTLHEDKRFDEVYKVQLFRSFYLLSSSDTAERDAAEHSFKRMLEFIPEERRPANADVELFTSVDINRLLLTGYRDGSHREIRILGASQKEAEARAKVLLAFFDQGFTRPIQLALLELRNEKCARIHKLEKERSAAEALLPSLTKELANYADFTTDMLSGLRVQQLQLEVELAGVKARLATCEKLLSGRISDDRRKQIEDVKIAAEIELSGFEARQAKSAELIAKVKTKGELSAKATHASEVVSNARQNSRTYAQEVQRIDEQLAAFDPVKLQDDRVAIHPIEWTQQ